MLTIASLFTLQIPFYAAFSKTNDIILDMVKNEEVRPMLVLSLIVDCMFVLDIFLNFRTTFIQSSSDVLEKDPKKLAVYYLKTWFIIDLLAAIPFDWIMHSSTNDGRNVRIYNDCTVEIPLSRTPENLNIKVIKDYNLYSTLFFFLVRSVIFF